MNRQCFFNDFPIIDLGNLVLREIEVNDAYNYLNYMNRKEMQAFLTEDNIPQNLQEAEKEIKYWRDLFHDKRSIYWAIVLKETDQIIGTAGFNFISFANSRADISYDLNPDYWGRGLMLNSIKAILKFSDQILKLVRIQATVIVDNKRSIKMLDRCQFQKEGLLKKYELVDKQYKDYYMYARVQPII